MLFKFNRTVRLWQLSLIVVCFLLGWKQSYAADEASDIHEHQVKATFFLSFSKFVTYPESVFADVNSPLNVCILGDDPFQNFLDTLVKDTKIQGRLVKVNYLREVGKISECHVLFVSKSEQKQFVSIITRFKRHPILTVSDIEEFVTRGGMIQLYLNDNKVHFLIDPITVNEAKLQMSARLLQLAKIVK